MKLKKSFVIVLCGILLLFGGCSAVTKISYPTDFKAIVLKYCKKNNLDAYTVFAMIKKESKFVCDAQSDKGAKGLMQLTDDTAKWTAEKEGIENFKEEMLFDPETNIRLGCAYFAYLLEMYNNDKNLALCAYNAGPGRVSEWLSDKSISENSKTLNNKPYSETENYLEDILGYEQKYKQLYPDLQS